MSEVGELQADYPADIEEGAFRHFVEVVDTSIEFVDPLYSRVRDAVRDLQSGSATGLDVATLVRQVLRRASLRDGSDYRLPTSPTLGPTADDYHACGITLVRTAGGLALLQASPWTPSWLDWDLPIDEAAAAGTRPGRRAEFDKLPADPFFEAATGHRSYRTAGQRAAIRAAASMAPNGTLVALLPTGSGKTEIATTLAHLARRETTIIVVPTVALAYDFERRFRETYAAKNARVNVEQMVFAWTGETDANRRKELRSHLTAGRLPLLVTSPESLTGALLHSARSAAEAGRLRALVIDEAHLVTQWGRDFRPEFRHLAGLRQDLLRRCESGGHPGFRTVLLSATLGAAELDDLVSLFGSPGPVSLVAANALRPEPEYWVAPITSRREREDNVLEAVRHLARPMILYVTKPDEADGWVHRLRAGGFRRVAVVTGRSAGADRRSVLEGLRAGDGRTSRFDVVVATSAFGLGIDNDQIRTVVHACIPETLDRWYQEVGRSGRDGHASTALLLPAIRDEDEARSLGITMLKPDTARKRWAALWGGRVSREGATHIDLHVVLPDVGAGSYNRRWNAQVLSGLQELGQISRRSLSIGEAAELQLPIGSAESPHEWEQVELTALEAHQPSFFETNWETWRLGLIEDSNRALAQMTAALRDQSDLCGLLATAYEPGDAAWDTFGVAAEGIQPRPGCGRCPGCRTRGVSPRIERPPRGTYTWDADTPTTSALEALMSADPSGPRLAVLHADESDDVVHLADLLGSAGVRTFAGVIPRRPPTAWWCVDDGDVHPADLPPFPALVVLPDAAQVEPTWFAPALRAHDGTNRPIPVVLVVKNGQFTNSGGGGTPQPRTLNARIAAGLIEREMT